MIEKKLISGIEELGLNLEEDKIAKLVKYVELLDKWNKAFNLTAVRDPMEMVSRHILDSLSIISHIDGDLLLDVGTGPGLPGIPIAICFPEKQLYLLDSNIKKTRFLTQCSIELGLPNIEVVHSRAEEFIPPQKFDMIVSRAFAPLKNIIGWCQHLLLPEGRFLAMKGPYPQEEIEELPPGFVLEQSMEVTIPGNDAERNLLFIAKN